MPAEYKGKDFFNPPRGIYVSKRTEVSIVKEAYQGRLLVILGRFLRLQKGVTIFCQKHVSYLINY